MSSSNEVTRPRHPGRGRNKTRPTARGRQVDANALEEVRAVVGTGPHPRDHLIELLHLVNDRFGQLSGQHLAALAHELKISMAEIYEVATFYAHFDVVEDGTTPCDITVRICDSLSCEMAGSIAVQAQLTETVAARGLSVRVVAAPCMGRCDQAPVAEVGHRHVAPATRSALLDAIEARDLDPAVNSYETLEDYRRVGGYALLEACRSGQHEVNSLIRTLDDAGLRGLGGAGFPTGRKWNIVRSFPGPRLMAVNADEGEPGTFKDREYLEQRPHRFLEGMLLASWAVEAERIYLYLRDEYPGIRKTLQTEISRLENDGCFDRGFVELRRGAGAYICGEESAMLESIEGKRGLPRHRPPYVAENGLFGRPTLVQNVETLYWLPEILTRGADWFAEQGRQGGRGPRTYSVSGRIRSPGIKVAPAGVSARELIDEFCDGMLEGHKFKGYLPGGASGGILPASMGDLPLEFGSLEPHGCFVGSHAVVILSDQDNIADVALNLMRFFENESCGQCTPCRVGTEKAVALMSEKTWNRELLSELAQTMTDASICGLGQAAANPLLRAMEHFPQDIPGHVFDPD